MFTRAVVVFAKVAGRILAYPVVVDSGKILSSLLVLLALAVASADQLGAVGPPFSVDLSHFAAGGGWNTLWSVVNTSPGPNQCTLTIVGPDGKPLSLTTTAGTGSSINIGVALGGSAVIQAGGPTGSVLTGADKACQGSMYFYFLGKPEHVFGAAFLNNGSGIAEGPDGIYTMTVDASDFHCMLRNTVTTQTKALTNTVHVGCTFKNALAAAGTGTADVTNSIVNVTGPPN